MLKKESILDFEIFDDSLIPLAKKWMPEGQKTGMESEEAFEKRRLLQFKEMLKHWFHDIEEGFGYFLTHSSPACQEKLKALTEGDAFVDLQESILNQSFVMAKPLKLNREDLDALYELACSHQNDNIPLAQKLFMTLIFLDFTQVRFWLGLAFTHYQQHDFLGAQKIYAISIIIGNEDPVPYLFYARFLRMQNDPLADLAIEEGIQRASKEPLDHALLREFNSLKRRS